MYWWIYERSGKKVKRSIIQFIIFSKIVVVITVEHSSHEPNLYRTDRESSQQWCQSLVIRPINDISWNIYTWIMPFISFISWEYSCIFIILINITLIIFLKKNHLNLSNFFCRLLISRLLINKFFNIIIV